RVTEASHDGITATINAVLDRGGAVW
ncbi:MAG: hypothetical protein QOJ19_4117, partial [Acidimicrobiia bacterium]|nr:hypothetical protein [Acidimicrobiia bacterium]